MQGAAYDVSVCIPARASANSLPRTNRAAYTILTVDGPVVRYPDQQVQTSGWVSLGTFRFLGPAYTIVLTDETGEISNSRSVVSDAVRVNPQ
jgi:hypothetical protein